MYLGQHSVKLEMAGRYLFWLEDRLEDIPLSSLSSNLYCVYSQSVAPILGDMADFFAYRVIVCVVVSASVWCRFICVPNDILGV